MVCRTPVLLLAALALVLMAAAVCNTTAADATFEWDTEVLLALVLGSWAMCLQS